MTRDLIKWLEQRIQQNILVLVRDAQKLYSSMSTEMTVKEQERRGEYLHVFGNTIACIEQLMCGVRCKGSLLIRYVCQECRFVRFHVEEKDKRRNVRSILVSAGDNLESDSITGVWSSMDFETGSGQEDKFVLRSRVFSQDVLTNSA